jgi:hypothetical protein
MSEEKAITRDGINGRFLRGFSGNPRGRPPVVAEIRELAREHAPAAFRRLLDLVQSRDERVALAAVTALLDRAYGRPVQAVQSEVKTLDMSKLYAMVMKEMRDGEGAKPVTIDGTEATTTIEGTEPIDGAVIIEQAEIDREEEGEEW